MKQGSHHKKVPRDVAKNIAYRRKVTAEAKKSKARQEELKKWCQEDILFYINTFVWQFNPKTHLGGEVGPFVTWPFQEEALLSDDTERPGILWCIENQEDLVVEKSREMGASWLFLIVMDWMARSFRNQQFGMMSRSADAVDCASADSLFWKISFINKYLPPWLKGNVVRRSMYIGYDDMESQCTGQASTEKAFIGGRARCIFLDEFSRVREAGQVLDYTSDVTDCRIFNGTHRGVGTAFHKLTEDPNVKKLVMHWTQHPAKRPGMYRYLSDGNRVDVIDKTYSFPENFKFNTTGLPAGGAKPGVRSPWYDKQCLRKGSARAIAEDLDIDPSGSVSQVFDTKIVRALQASYAHPPRWEGDITVDHETGDLVALVKRAGGPLKLWLQPGSNQEVEKTLYCMGADVSTGLGKTPSVLSIANGRTGEKVAELTTAVVKPELFAAVACALGRHFKDEKDGEAFFAWEHAGPGELFGRTLMELGYGNIYYRESTLGLTGVKASSIPGWHPSVKAKRLLIDEYRAALDRRWFVNHSHEALEECLGYRFNQAGEPEHPLDKVEDDPSGARLNHGDHVIADGLCWLGVKQLGIVVGKLEAEQEESPVGSLGWRRKLATRERSGRWNDAMN